MIEIEGVLLHEDIINKAFVCDLQACKGACCIEGDAGAPLEKTELAVLDDIYPAVKPFMSTEGVRTVEQSGTHVVDADGDYTTPCIDGNKACAYVTWENGISKCAIEKAYEAGAIAWKKPISCHLYPIRITTYPAFDALQYERWHICQAACSNGHRLQVPVYRFLKEPLIRKYGADWYEALEEATAAYQAESKEENTRQP